MKTALLVIGSSITTLATLASGQSGVPGISIDVVIKDNPMSGNTPIGSGCADHEQITSHEECYAAATALRDASLLPEEESNTKPYPATHYLNGWTEMPKGCNIYISEGKYYVHFNDGPDAGTGVFWDGAKQSICLDHDPQILKKATTPNADGQVEGNVCSKVERIRSEAQCLDAARNHGYAGTLHTPYIDTTYYSGGLGIAAGLYTSCAGVSTWQYAAHPCANGVEGVVDCDTTYSSSADSFKKQMCKFGRLLHDHTSVVIPPINIPEGCFLWEAPGEEDGTVEDVLIYKYGTDDSADYPAKYSHGLCTSGHVWMGYPEVTETLENAPCDHLAAKYQQDDCCESSCDA